MMLHIKTMKIIKKWPFILDHPYIMLIVGGSGSGKKWIIQFNKGTRRYW